jgi:hypothetical protein
LEISIEIPDKHLEDSLDKVMKLELKSRREISVIIHRLESTLVSQPVAPEWTDNHEWAERMFQIHKTDRQVMNIDYLKNAGKKTNIDHIINDWIED